MIIVDESGIKVGGIILPGIFRQMEIDATAKVDEVDVKGKSVKPKQATGYEDAKINLGILLVADDIEDEFTKLEKIQNIFKKPNQKKPLVYEVVNKHLNIRGINNIIFKKLSSKETNKSDELLISCEFWEYIPINIKATNKKSAKTASSKKTSKATNNNSSGVSREYEEYLKTRGNAPKLEKTKHTPAKDND
jgi:hypothetical protein